MRRIPTLLVLAPDGSEIERRTGFMPADEVLALLTATRPAAGEGPSDTATGDARDPAVEPQRDEAAGDADD